MCSPLLSPLGSAIGGSRTGLAMLSPAAAMIAGKKKDKPQASRHELLYGSAG